MEDLSTSAVSEVCAGISSRPFSGDGLEFLPRAVGSANCDRETCAVCVAVAMGAALSSSLESEVETLFSGSSGPPWVLVPL